jgi:hypothetical protein
MVVFGEMFDSSRCELESKLLVWNFPTVGGVIS